MSSIRLATASNVRAFQNLSHALSAGDGIWAGSIDCEALDDEIGRFRVWSGNLGALQKGHSSLDYRLRDSPLLSGNALRFLEELQDNLNEAFAIVSGARLPYEQQPKPEKPEEEEEEEDDFFDKDEDEDDESDSSRTELSMRFVEIVDIIDNLYKLSVRIRTPTIRSRSLKAATYKPKDPETGVDILATYAGYDLQHIKELLSHLRQPYLGKAQSEDHDYLIPRLSAAITLRRRQFKYWKRHRDKLGVSTVLEEQSRPMELELTRPVLPQRNDTLEVHPDPPVILTTNDALSQKTGRTLLSGTEATQYHQSLDEIVDTKSVTSYAVTVKDIRGRGVDLPPPPRAADGEKDFECPYCYIICPARYGRGRAWRTHLLQDLQPYLCTFPDCDSSEQLFRSRREWTEHEASHRKAWRCPEHPAAVFKSHEGLEDHLRREHSGSFPQSQLATIVKVGETTTVDVRSICPICYAPADTEGLGDFHNHVANHLERIATFSLPNGTEGESDGASSAASRGRSESSGSRNISSLSLPSDSTLDMDDDEMRNSTSTASKPASRAQANSDGLEDPTSNPTQTETAADRTLLSAESLHQIPDESNNRLDTLLGSQRDSRDDLVDTEETEAASSVSSSLLTYDQEEDRRKKVSILNVSDIPTLHLLYRSRRLPQRDQSFAPNDAYNQVISFCYHDLTRLKVDAIVNSANRTMRIRRGETLNNAIHIAAGPGLMKETQSKGEIEPGQAVVTNGYDLPSAHIIHAARPGYSHYKSKHQLGQSNQLIDCYRSALAVAVEYELKTIAFPCLGTGGVGIPPRVAARIALQEIRESLDAHPEYSFERIIFCVNSAADEQAYMDFLPVFFPPTHGDLDVARSSVWSEDRTALAVKVLDTRNQVHLVFTELNSRLSLTMPDFPQTIVSELAAIDSGLASIRRFMLWSKELNRILQDLKLICSVLREFCGNITEMIELAKDSGNIGTRTDRSIWDDYFADMKRRHGTDVASFLEDCRSFVERLDDIITRKGNELEDMPAKRTRLEKYKAKQRGQSSGGMQGRLNVFDEVLYTREFQRDAAKPAPTRSTVKLHQIRSVSQLFRLGELGERPTLAHPSAMFNQVVCLVREDITKLEVDIMVNSTDMSFAGMGTLDRTVFTRAGPELSNAVKAFGVCKAGDVMTTVGYALPAKHLLHVVPPEQYGKNATDILRKIYREVLWKAVEMRATSIAIPSIGTGMLNYPRRDSASLALEEVRRFLETAEPNSLLEKIIFVVYSSNDEFIYKSLLPVYFPPIDLNVNRGLPASQPTEVGIASLSSKFSEPSPRAVHRTLFGSIGEAFRSVRFGKQPETSRPVDAYEEDALIGFESHAKDCDICKDPKRLYFEGRDLCEQGYSLAQLVLWCMNMLSDQSVWMKPDINGQSVKLEVPAELFPISLRLLSTVERSYRDGDRSRPFVSLNRPYGAIIQDQAQKVAVPPGVTIYNTEVQLPVEGEPKKARAHVFTWSKLANRWDAVFPGECHIRVYSSRVDIRESLEAGDDQMPLVSLKIDDRSMVQRHRTTPEVTLAGATRLESVTKTNGDVLFRCRSDAECNSLLRMLRRVIEQSQNDSQPPLADSEPQAENIRPSFKGDQTATDEYPQWNQRLKDIHDELASVKKASGGLSDLQFKMERLSTASANLPAIPPKHGQAVSELYNASRSPLATRVLVCLTADLKTRPGSYVGMATASIVSALRKTPEEISAALDELVAEGQIHNTLDENTWALSHPPPELPVIATQQPQTGAQEYATAATGLQSLSSEQKPDAALSEGNKPPALDREHESTGPTRSSDSTQIRDASSFNDTPPSPSLPSLTVSLSASAPPAEATASDLSSLNIDKYLSYPSPFGARWTRINKYLVDPQILVDADEEFDDTGDSLVVHRVLRRGEVEKWAQQSLEMRLLRELRERRDAWEGEAKKREREDRDMRQDNLDRVLAGDMKEEELRHFADTEHDERYI